MNHVRNGEAKGLICMTHGHELSGEKQGRGGKMRQLYNQ